ncbi:MAG: M20/M25/M40 family metallo-hydrolase [Candidatus Limimorpha sp.]
MKKIFLTIIVSVAALIANSQVPHLFQHDFPTVAFPDKKVEALLEKVDVSSLQQYVSHLTSYINRRCDGRYIYDVKDWLIDHYESLGVDSVMVHDFDVIPFWDTVPRPFTTAGNVIAIKIGKTKPQEVVICGAHYDSWVVADEPYDVDTLVSPGADDNAVGVAGILVAADILSKCDFERTVIFANWNAEEVGLCGSHAFARDCSNDSIDIVAYFNLDMGGYLKSGGDIHIDLLYTPCDSLLGDYVIQVSNTYLENIPIGQAWLTGGDTDYSSFNRHGYQAISPSEDVHNMSPYIHSVNDIVGLSVNSWEQMEVFTKLNLASVAVLAGMLPESTEEVAENNILIYPNPSDEMIMIEGDYEFFEVFDVDGSIVLYRNVSDIKKVPVSISKPGIYFIRFTLGNGNCITKKVIIQSNI